MIVKYLLKNDSKTFITDKLVAQIEPCATPEISWIKIKSPKDNYWSYTVFNSSKRFQFSNKVSPEK